MLLLALRALGGSVYGQIAERRLDRLPDARADTASRIAAGLAPWKASLVGLRGWVLTESTQPEHASATYLRALRWAPGDPLLWNEFALALARHKIFDQRLLAATRRALELAPASPAVRGSIAAMGLAYWPRGTTELRELWRQSMRWELDHNRESFLLALEARGNRIAFCLRYAPGLGEEAWCRGEQPAGG